MQVLRLRQGKRSSDSPPRANRCKPNTFFALAAPLAAPQPLHDPSSVLANIDFAGFLVTPNRTSPSCSDITHMFSWDMMGSIPAAVQVGERERKRSERGDFDRRARLLERRVVGGRPPEPPLLAWRF